MTDAAMHKAAADQINLEIGQATAPIQSQITTTQANKDKALGQIGGMFDALQPVVQQGAQAVQQGYDKAMSQEHAVFAEAQAQLQSLRGNRAADAQAMAQKTGGPVAIGDWTTPFDNAATDLTYLGAGQELHTLAYAQAGEQQAQQFAGQVFPLVRTEQMAATRNQFETQIREYEDQIVALKSQKGAQVNKRYNELRAQELDYGLKRAQQQLDKLDSQRDYDLEVKKAKATKVDADRTFGLQKQELQVTKKKNADDLKVALLLAGDNKKKTALAYKQFDLANKEYDLAVAKETGVYKGQKTLAGKQTDATIRATDAQIKNAADTLGLSNKEFLEKKHEFAVNSKLEGKRLAANKQTEWVSLMDNAINPQPGKTYTTTEDEEISQDMAFLDPDAYTKTINGKVHYFKGVEKTHTVPAMDAITNPTKLVDYLVVSVNDKSMSRSRAIQIVKTRIPELANWKYGSTWPPKSKTGGKVRSDILATFLNDPTPLLNPGDTPSWMDPRNPPLLGAKP
jgi:ElaB/YqjD/DUF883 family membrane-anchored ribosome-binding protein